MAEFGSTKELRGDPKLWCTHDGGEFEIVGGKTTMEVFLYNFCYLALFGGNYDDPGGEDQSKSWWGNRDEENPNNQYRSRTQYLLNRLPTTTSNIVVLEKAAKDDLQKIIDVGAANDIAVGAQLIAPKHVRFIIIIEAYGKQFSFEFVVNWLAMAEEVEDPETPLDTEFYLVTEIGEYVFDDNTSQWLVE